SDHHRNSLGDHVLNCGMHRVVVGGNWAAQAHIHDVYAVGIRSHVIQTGDHRGVRATARAIEHFDGIDLSGRCDANNAETVISCGDDSGDMGSVSVVVLG